MISIYETIAPYQDVEPLQRLKEYGSSRTRNHSNLNLKGAHETSFICLKRLKTKSLAIPWKTWEKWWRQGGYLLWKQ